MEPRVLNEEQRRVAAKLAAVVPNAVHASVLATILTSRWFLGKGGLALGEVALASILKELRQVYGAPGHAAPFQIFGGPGHEASLLVALTKLPVMSPVIQQIRNMPSMAPAGWSQESWRAFLPQFYNEQIVGPRQGPFERPPADAGRTADDDFYGRQFARLARRGIAVALRARAVSNWSEALRWACRSEQAWVGTSWVARQYTIGELVARGHINPDSHLKPAKTIEYYESGALSIDPHDPERPAFWFEVLDPFKFGAWPDVGAAFQSIDPALLGRFALATYHEFAFWLLGKGAQGAVIERGPDRTKAWASRLGGHGEADSAEYSAALQRLARILAARLATRNDDSTLAGALWLYARRGFDERKEVLDDGLRCVVVESAREFLGKLRKSAEAGESAKSQFTIHAEAAVHAASAVAALDSLWHALKPLLLTLRNLRVPSVARNLSLGFMPTGNLPAEGMKEPWGRIPALIHGLTQNYIGREQRYEPNLHHLRQDFAQYCLDRLKPRDPRDGEDASRVHMTEPDPDWRRACVGAALALAVNPQGRGHKTLIWSAQHDPDERVRFAAKRAVDRLQHREFLSTAQRKHSPRRGVFAAEWWMRVGHMLALKQPVTIDAKVWRREMRMTMPPQKTKRLAPADQQRPPATPLRLRRRPQADAFQKEIDMKQ